MDVLNAMAARVGILEMRRMHALSLSLGSLQIHQDVQEDIPSLQDCRLLVIGAAEAHFICMMDCADICHWWAAQNQTGQQLPTSVQAEHSLLTRRWLLEDRRLTEHLLHPP